MVRTKGHFWRWICCAWLEESATKYHWTDRKKNDQSQQKNQKPISKQRWSREEGQRKHRIWRKQKRFSRLTQRFHFGNLPWRYDQSKDFQKRHWRILEWIQLQQLRSYKFRIHLSNRLYPRWLDSRQACRGQKSQRATKWLEQERRRLESWRLNAS